MKELILIFNPLKNWLYKAKIIAVYIAYVYNKYKKKLQ